jgi:hypothetical protein
MVISRSSTITHLSAVAFGEGGSTIISQPLGVEALA